MNTDAMPAPKPPLHSVRPLRRRHFNRLFAAVYASAILSLLYHHVLKLLHSTTLASFFVSLLLFISDAVLAYMWSTTQAFRINPVHRQVFLENLQKVLDRKDFPAMDIFICTADPYKEPPIDVVNTALSVMAYDYPTEKLSVYVSDDGGSELTMFAFMEAAKFGKQWLPFCRENNITDRCPDAFFTSNYALTVNTMEIKAMYESMKMKVETSVEGGKVKEEYICSDEERQLLTQFRTKDFTRQNHPSIIQ
ncbi:Cellulose synthase-like protein G3, partial [Sesamum alatum]